MKILVYSFNDKLGDGLQKISFLQKLKKIYPSSFITYTTTNTTTLKSLLYPLLTDVIDEFIEENNIRSSLFDLFKNNLKFKNSHFDLIIDLQKVVLRTLNLKKISHKVFFSASANFLFSDVKNNQNLKFKGIYIERFYYNILSLINNVYFEDIENISVPYTEAPKIINQKNKKIIGIAPGAGNPIREWGFEKYLEVAKKLRQDDYRVVFFLGPNEKKYLDLCRTNNFDCPEWNEKSMISKSILFIMNLAKQVDCLLCNDGGTSWIFEFAGIKTFKIFGVTNEKKFARPNYCKTLQVKDFGYNSLQSFPTDLYIAELNNYLKSI